ncbi:hypothetical protein GA069_23780 [Vibrio parahaemolyticus]|nr:hypothetical protein [Vibrio parahaemolyticus]
MQGAKENITFGFSQLWIDIENFPNNLLSCFHIKCYLGSVRYLVWRRKLRISVIAIARFGLFRSPDPAVFLSSYFYSK